MKRGRDVKKRRRKEEEGGKVPRSAAIYSFPFGPSASSLPIRAVTLVLCCYYEHTITRQLPSLLRLSLKELLYSTFQGDLIAARPFLTTENPTLY